MAMKRNVILIGLCCLFSVLGSVHAQEKIPYSEVTAAKPRLNCPLPDQMPNHNNTHCICHPGKWKDIYDDKKCVALTPHQQREASTYRIPGSTMHCHPPAILDEKTKQCINACPPGLMC